MLRTAEEASNVNSKPLPKVLADHGLDAEIHQREPRETLSGEWLLDAAHRLGADLMVMGAYTRHPIFEILLGGVTRYMLSHTDLPILMRVAEITEGGWPTNRLKSFAHY